MMAEGYNNHDGRYILAESGKMRDPTTEQILEEEDEMRDNSNIMGNSSTNVISDRKKAEQQQLKPKPNTLIPKPLPIVKPIQTSKSALTANTPQPRAS